MSDVFFSKMENKASVCALPVPVQNFARSPNFWVEACNKAVRQKENIGKHTKCQQYTDKMIVLRLSQRVYEKPLVLMSELSKLLDTRFM